MRYMCGFVCVVDLEGLECYEDADVGLDPLKPAGDDCYEFYPEDEDGARDIPSHIDAQVHSPSL